MSRLFSHSPHNDASLDLAELDGAFVARPGTPDTNTPSQKKDTPVSESNPLGGMRLRNGD